ncbi:hypothetical protein EYF80_043531 [Liparis tanakae]|uniref:Uncharacterized protein n=1 Tax=Liparis tanakae TaxID=230148 RepID=A0A4Z2G074_9TELE|nr:hypothetical protein EYF80_043531 [Liparis tanakae]
MSGISRVGMPSYGLPPKVISSQMQPRQAEVGDLDVIGRLHQHVAGRQVPVDQPPLLQVHHPLRERERERL